MDEQIVMDQAQMEKIKLLLPQLIPLQEKAAAASREYTAVLGANDPARQLKSGLAFADAEEAVATLLAPFELSDPFSPAHSAGITVIHLTMAADLLTDANDIERADKAYERAFDIAVKWCSQTKALDVRCRRADWLSGRGRFAEALTEFAKVRDAAESARRVKIEQDASLNDKALAELRDDTQVAELEKVVWDATLNRIDLLLWLGSVRN